MSEKLKVLFVSPEIVPFKATGGLADVSEALPHALKEENVDTIRIMPKYQGIEDKFELEKIFSFIVEVGGKANVADIYKIENNDLVTYFVGNDRYFERTNVYGYLDDDQRFGFFCKAVLEMLIFLDYQPDVIHLNDWQTALIGLYLKEEYSELDFYKNMKVVFTIHNLQYQGIFDKNSLNDLNLSFEYFNEEKVEYYGKVCFMKAGIVYADLVSTVSKTYAKEIQTQRYGYGLDGLLRKYSDKITGILNGIFYSKYDPQIDPALKVNFSSEDFRKLRAENKEALQKEVGLPVKNVPLFGVVTRLAEQKGIELIIRGMKELVEEDVQFIILGSGEHSYEHRISKLAEEHGDKICSIIEFNQDVARRIYGASDFFLMPSLFEPCGLSQLYSLRYGSIPIVRETGGLLDTITDLDKDSANGNGFSFSHFKADEFVVAIRRGMELYSNRRKMNQIIERAMNQRYTWSKAAKEYIENYKEIM